MEARIKKSPSSLRSRITKALIYNCNTVTTVTPSPNTSSRLLKKVNYPAPISIFLMNSGINLKKNYYLCRIMINIA